MRVILVSSGLCLLLSLPGCLGSQQNTIHQEAPVSLIPPAAAAGPVALDPQAVVSALRPELTASSNATQNQLNGLVNASVSKLGEKVVGLESNLRDLLHLQNTATLTAQTELQAKLQASLQATAELKLALSAITQLNTSVDTKVSALTQFETRLETSLNALTELRLRVESVATGQAGLSNSIQTLKAGRDVNQLPTEAVYLLLGITGSLCGLFTTIVTLIYRASRQRAALSAQEEREERQQTYGVLLEVLSLLPSGDHEKLQPKLQRLLKPAESKL